MASVKNVGGIGIGIGIWIWISLLQLQLMQVAKCDPNTSIGIWRCNLNEYSPNGVYNGYVEDLFSDLIQNTAEEEYDYYNNRPGFATPVVFGHATCTTMPSYKDCVTCVQAAVDAVKNICPFKIGGTVELGDCTIRYENYDF